MINVDALRKSLIASGFLNDQGTLSRQGMANIGNSAFGSYGGEINIGSASPSGFTGAGPAAGSVPFRGTLPTSLFSPDSGTVGNETNRVIGQATQNFTPDQMAAFTLLGADGVAAVRDNVAGNLSGFRPSVPSIGFAGSNLPGANLPVFGDNVSIPDIVKNNLPTTVPVNPVSDTPAPKPIDIGDQDPGGVFSSGRDPLFNPDGSPKTGGTTTPPAPTTTGGGSTDGGFDLGSIIAALPSIFGRGNDMSALPLPDDLKYLESLPIFGGSSTGGTATATGGNSSLTNTLSDLLNLSLNLGATDYAADKMLEANRMGIDFSQGIYNDQVDRLEPFRQSGIGALGGLSVEAANNPALYNMFAGQYGINPDINVQGPQASTVDVNQVDLLDTENPFYRAAQAEGMRNIESGAAAGGRLNSGGTLDALNQSGMATYLNYVPTLQSVSSARDQMNLAANQQGYGQQLTSAGFDQGQQQQNLQNRFAQNSQLFNQFLGANQFNQGVDTNRFNQFLSAAQLGGNAAANQGNGSSQLGVTGAGLLANMGDIRGARTDGFINGLAGYF